MEIWLDASEADPADVGLRAAALSRLLRAGLVTPRAFVIGRAPYERFAAGVRPESAALAQVPHDVGDRIAVGVRALGGPVAVRRSPLGEPARRPARGRPDRESYLHLVDPTDVIEAVRRLWGRAAAAQAPTAAIVQAFVLPDASAVVVPEGPRLRVESTYGIGDLLAAELVVPDRHVLARADGAIVEARLGRKAQMTVPKNDGGVLRVPVPTPSAMTFALAEEELAALAALFAAAERALGTVETLCASLVGRAWHVTGARIGASPPPVADDLLLG